MKCSNCGAELPEGAKFCVVCGQTVIQPVNPAQQPMQQGYPQQQPMQQGYPQQQPMQQGYPQQHYPKPTINQARVPFMDAVKSAFMNHYFDFNGRASRSEFWWTYAAVNGASCILWILMMIFFKLDNGFGTVMGWIFSIILIALQLGSICPMIGLGVRRLHDIGKSGLLYLLNFVPLANFVVIYWWIQESEPQPNQYGNIPHLIG